MNGSTRRRTAAAVVLLCFAHGAAAQTRPAEAMEGGTAGWQVGGEIDALPYALGGAYGSLFLAHDGWRVRAVVSRTEMPASWVEDGFTDQRTDAYALLVDRFLGGDRRELRGFWVGAGVERWRNRIRREGSPACAHYDDTMATAGGGYVWRLSHHVYVNPWVAGHLVVAGQRNIDVDGSTYTQRRFTAEGSVKIGLVF